MVWLTDALVVCRSGDIPTTVTFSATFARPSVTVGRLTSPLRSVMPLTSVVEKPDSSTRMV